MKPTIICHDFPFTSAPLRQDCLGQVITPLTKMEIGVVGFKMIAVQYLISACCDSGKSPDPRSV